jgi:hypothetical protein
MPFNLRLCAADYVLQDTSHCAPLLQASAAAPVGAAVTAAAAAAQAASGSHGRFAASVADIAKPQVESA